MSLENLPANLRHAREQAKLTQAEAAERTEISRIAYNRIERGKMQPSIATLERLAEILGTTAAKLLR